MSWSVFDKFYWLQADIDDLSNTDHDAVTSGIPAARQVSNFRFVSFVDVLTDSLQ